MSWKPELDKTWTIRGKRAVFFTLVFLLANTADSVSAEFITVPAEGSATIVDEDYSLARKKAINSAFRASVRSASAGLTSSNSYQINLNLIERNIVSRGREFVSSYKILDETIDPVEKRLKISMQVTLFLDSVRTSLRQRGVGVKKPPLPNVMVLVDEKNAEFFSNPNFLMLDSLSEKLISRAFRQRGYTVSNRIDIRRSNMGSVALNAFTKKRTSIMRLRRTFETDLFVFGVTEVFVEKDNDNSVVTAQITTNLVGSNGDTLATYTGRAKGVYIDPLSGSLELIKVASSKVIQNMTVETPRIWRHAMGGYRGE